MNLNSYLGSFDSSISFDASPTKWTHEGINVIYVKVSNRPPVFARLTAKVKEFFYVIDDHRAPLYTLVLSFACTCSVLDVSSPLF